MKKGTVKVIAISAGGNATFRNGDKVTEKQFPEGEFDRLVKEGYIDPAEKEKQKSVKEIEKLLSEMDGFADIDELVLGDEREGVIKAAEARKTEIREASASEAEKANEEKAKAAKEATLEKISKAKTEGVLRAIMAGNTDKEILEAAAKKVEDLQAAKAKKEDPKKEEKTEEKKEDPKKE